MDMSIPQSMQSKPNRKDLRLHQYDYSQPGYYFITICTKDRIHHFGEIIGDEIKLSPLGKIADLLWHEIPKHFHNIELDEYIVMPNHIHGIVIITETNIPTVGNRHAYSLHNGRLYEFLPIIIGSFKSAVTKHIHQNQPSINFA